MGLSKNSLNETIDLFNRPDYKFNKKNKFDNNILKKVPDTDYISSRNQISTAIEQTILKDRKNISKLDMVYKESLGAGGSEVIKTSL